VDSTILRLVVFSLPLFVIVGLALFDVLARQPSMQLVQRAGWVAVIVLLPVLGALGYALFRPPRSAAGKATAEHEEARSVMRRLGQMIEHHDTGALSDEEFTREKSELFGR
jgi:hypothetical protein